MKFTLFSPYQVLKISANTDKQANARKLQTMTRGVKYGSEGHSVALVDALSLEKMTLYHLFAKSF